MNRVLLLKWLIFAGWGIGIAGNIIDFLHPSLLGSSQDLAAAQSRTPMQMSGILLSALGFAEFVALIGVWLWRRWGRMLFSCALTLEIILTCFGSPTLRSGLGFGLTLLSFTILGGIMALIWCSSLSEKFGAEPAQPCAAPNGGPAAPLGNSGGISGPPSVS